MYVTSCTACALFFFYECLENREREREEEEEERLMRKKVCVCVVFG